MAAALLGLSGCPNSETDTAETDPAGSVAEHEAEVEPDASGGGGTDELSRDDEITLRVLNRDSIEPHEVDKLRLVLQTEEGRYLGPVGEIWNEPAHLFIHSVDLLWFNHLTPSVNASGEFVSDVRFPSPGQFRILLIVRPEGFDEPLRLEHELELPGRNPQQANVSSQMQAHLNDGLSLQLSSPDAPASNTSLELDLTADRTPQGSPMELAEDPPEPMQLGEIFGGKFFVTAIRFGSDRRVFRMLGEEAVSTSEGDHFEAKLPLEFPEGGKWKIWVEFEFGGEMRIASFILQVA